jgi:plastocyanin
MNKKILAIILGVMVVVVLGGVGLLLWRQAKQTPAATTQNQPQAQPSSNVRTTNQTISIKDMSFTPNFVTIKKGVTITWMNSDAVSHSVVANDAATGGGLPLDGNVLSTGQSYAHTFDATGTFSYHCGIHPSMTGTVEVVE